MANSITVAVPVASGSTGLGLFVYGSGQVMFDYVSLIPRKTPNIIFETNGGSVVASISGAKDSAITMPADPTKTGAEFLGWYTDAELTTPFTATTFPQFDITLYAKWKEQSWGTYSESDAKTHPQSFEDFEVKASGTFSVTSVANVNVYKPETYTAFDGEKVAEVTAAKGNGTNILLTYDNCRYKLNNATVLGASAGMVDITVRYQVISGTPSLLFKTGTASNNNIWNIVNTGGQVTTSATYPLSTEAGWQEITVAVPVVANTPDVLLTAFGSGVVAFDFITLQKRINVKIDFETNGGSAIASVSAAAGSYSTNNNLTKAEIVELGEDAYDGTKAAQITARTDNVHGTATFLNFNDSRLTLNSANILNGSAGMVDVTFMYKVIEGAPSVFFHSGTANTPNNIWTLLNSTTKLTTEKITLSAENSTEWQSITVAVPVEAGAKHLALCVYGQGKILVDYVSLLPRTKPIITFVTNCSVIADPFTEDVGSDIVFPQLPEIVDEEYVFEGWYTDSDFTNKFIETKMPTFDTALYANYKFMYEIVNIPIEYSTEAIRIESIADANRTLEKVVVGQAVSFKALCDSTVTPVITYGSDVLTAVDSVYTISSVVKDQN